MKYISLILCLALPVVFTACGDDASRASKPTAMRNWQTEIGLSLPSSARLLKEGDGGGRDASFGFYEWVFESSSQIDMPKLKAPGVKDYLSLPLDSSTALIESRLIGRKIAKPTKALDSEWSVQGATFRGTLVRTPQADFLVVERFRK